MKIFFLQFVAAAVVLLLAAAVQAQTYPSKPVRIVVPYPPGGPTDVVARGVAQRLADAWGHPVLVDNRAGAGSTMGAEVVAKANADGYTLLFSDLSTFVLNPFLYSRLSYDPFKDFAPITMVCRLSWVLAVANDVPVKSLRELLDYAKANPGKLTYASTGNGTSAHVAMEDFKKRAGIDILHVPYKGGAPAVADLLGGRVSMFMVNYSVFEPHEKAGRLKVLAAATARRFAVRPDLPTIAEAGVPGFAVNAWFGMAAPAAAPVAILEKVQRDVAKIVGNADFQERFLRPQAFEAGGNSRAEFAAMLKTEAAQWKRLVASTGAKLD